MAKSEKRQNFLQGAALLSISVVIVKIIGAVYKIPLQNILGDVGFSYFNTAYKIYNLLLTISITGLPIATSRMISEAYSLGKYNQVRQIYKAAKGIFLTIGLVSTLIMALFCTFLAQMLRDPGAWTSILFLSPCALLMGFLSAYRGFFQGQSNMTPTSVSQVLEAFFKLIVGLAGAYLFMKLTSSLAWAAAGGILGVTVSCVISSLYLHSRFKRSYAELEVSSEEVDSFRRTASKLLSIAIPITIGSAGMELLALLEIGVYKGQIEHLFAIGQVDTGLVAQIEPAVMALKEWTPDTHFSLMASSLKGQYDFCYSIFNMPCQLIIPINTSVLPAITAYLTLGDHKAVRSTEESAARITGLMAAPCAVGLAVLATPIMGMLGGYTGEKLILAGQMLAILGGCVFVYAAMMFTNALLQSHGKVHIPVINTLICGCAKLVALYFVTGTPTIGILGVPLCSLVCYLAIVILNLVCIRTMVPQKPRLLLGLVHSLLPAGVMGVCVYLTHQGLVRFAGITSNTLLCGIPIIVGVVVYAVGIILTKSIKREDCMLLPKGEKIAKLLKL